MEARLEILEAIKSVGNPQCNMRTIANHLLYRRKKAAGTQRTEESIRMPSPCIPHHKLVDLLLTVFPMIKNDMVLAIKQLYLDMAFSNRPGLLQLASTLGLDEKDLSAYVRYLDETSINTDPTEHWASLIDHRAYIQ